jgi:hypothetical protein
MTHWTMCCGETMIKGPLKIGQLQDHKEAPEISDSLAENSLRYPSQELKDLRYQTLSLHHGVTKSRNFSIIWSPVVQ